MSDTTPPAPAERAAEPGPKPNYSMFNGLTAIAYKEFLHVIRDPATRFVFVIPLFQLLLFGFAIDLEVTNIPTAVVDLDTTAESRELQQVFANTATFDVVSVFPSTDGLDAALTAAQVKVGVVIPDGFARELRRGGAAEVLVMVDGSYSTEASTALSTAMAIGLWAPSQYANVRVETPDIHQRRAGPPRVDIRPRLLYNPNLRSANFFVPGLVGIILQLITLLLTSFAIVRERENGTFEQLMVTPVAAWGLLVGKLVPYLVIGIIETVLVLLAMVHAFGIPIAGSVPALLVLSVLFIITSLSLGVIISTFARTQTEAMQVSFLILLPSILLSGFMFPLSSVPAPVQPITYLIPVRYFIEILRGIIVRGTPLSALWFEAGALAVYTLVLLIIGAMRFRKRLD